MKRAMFLAAAALVAMSLLVPMAMAQGNASVSAGMESIPLCSEVTSMWQDVCRMPASASASTFPGPLGGTGGPAILMPAAALLLGSGILTYAVLKRR